MSMSITLTQGDLENGEFREKSGKKIFDQLMQKSGKSQGNSGKTVSQGKWNCFGNVLENFDIVHFVSIFCQRIRDINVTFCYTCSSGKLESLKIIVSHGIVRENENLKIKATRFSDVGRRKQQ